MEKILKWNPEFAKNIWLEFSLQRLIALPAIVLLIVFAVFSQTNDIDEGMKSLHYVSMAGFIIIGLLWGIKTSSDAILDEYNDKTWDWQKMSLIGPWKLTIGKLFGSTIYNWYGALICWILFMISGGYMSTWEMEFKTGILMIISMIATHGLMILISVQMVKKADGRTKLKSNRIFIAGIIFLGFVGNIFSVALTESVSNSNNISWYGLNDNIQNLIILSSVFYTMWIVAGVYRSMRAELQFSDAPTWWILFIVSNTIFQFGLIATNPEMNFAFKLATGFGFMFVQTLFITYILALTEPKDIVNFKLLIQSFQNKDFNLLFQNISLWTLTLQMVFIAGFLAVLFCSIGIQISSNIDILDKIKELNPNYLFIYLIAIFGFIIRDMGMLLYLNLSRTAKRADAAMIIYLIILYGLLPLLTMGSGIGVMFYPDFKANIIAMVAFPLIEAGVVIYLLKNRWSELHS